MVCAALDFLAMICQRTYYESYFAAEGVLGLIASKSAVLYTLLHKIYLQTVSV